MIRDATEIESMLMDSAIVTVITINTDTAPGPKKVIPDSGDNTAFHGGTYIEVVQSDLALPYVVVTEGGETSSRNRTTPERKRDSHS